MENVLQDKGSHSIAPCVCQCIGLMYVLKTRYKFADSLLFDCKMHTIKLVSNKINRLIPICVRFPLTKSLGFFEGLRCKRANR